MLASGTLVIIACAVGCTPPPKGAAPAAKVKGTAKMDGKLIPAGEIAFGIEGYPPTMMPIADGAFSGEAPIGKNQVEVFVFEEGPPSPRYPNVPTKKNIVPEKYAGPNTILEANVVAGGANDFKFELNTR
jgi:hypothetical protein